MQKNVWIFKKQKFQDLIELCRTDFCLPEGIGLTLRTAGSEEVFSPGTRIDELIDDGTRLVLSTHEV